METRLTITLPSVKMSSYTMKILTFKAESFRFVCDCVCVSLCVTFVSINTCVFYVFQSGTASEASS